MYMNVYTLIRVWTSLNLLVNPALMTLSLFAMHSIQLPLIYA
jgi:hypothetical protein